MRYNFTDKDGNAVTLRLVWIFRRSDGEGVEMVFIKMKREKPQTKAWTLEDSTHGLEHFPKTNPTWF